MDVASSLVQGFSAALSPANLFACFIGVLLGTLVGILPGLGPVATLSMLLPLTINMGPTASIIMFSGVFYGARYAGAITSVLANLPGESSSIMTCLDGYQMAKQGRAGPALGMAAIASFVAGTLGVVGLMLLAPTLARLAISFGPPEYFALMTMGLTLVTFLAGKSMVKALLMGCFGLALAVPGVDVMSGVPRLHFGQVFLLSGVDFVVVSMGLFAIGEILVNLEDEAEGSFFPVPKKLSELLPSLQDIKESGFTLVRSTIMGFLIGCVPGGTPTIATFIAYGTTKALAKDPEVFGTGTIRGVAGPEAADNAACSGGMIPLLTLGVPGGGSTAIMLAALMMAGLQPGPLLMQQQPEFFWTVIASLYIGNVILLVLNLPMVPLFANLLRVPYWIIYPLILGVCSVGVYSLDNAITDVFLMGFFGIVGYALKKLDFPTAPIVLAMVLGTMIEKSLVQSMVMFEGNALQFFQRPLSGAMLGLAIVLLTLGLFRAMKKAQIPVQMEDF